MRFAPPPSPVTHSPHLAARNRRRKFAAYKELSQRTERAATLDKLARRMEAEKAVMTGRGRKVKLAGATRDAAPAFRWKAERKR